MKQLIPKQHVETNNTTFSKSEKELRKPLKLAVNLKKCDFELVIFIHDDIIIEDSHDFVPIWGKLASHCLLFLCFFLTYRKQEYWLFPFLKIAMFDGF